MPSSVTNSKFEDSTEARSVLMDSCPAASTVTMTGMAILIMTAGRRIVHLGNLMGASSTNSVANFGCMDGEAKLGA
jgi:hypothetical protein